MLYSGQPKHEPLCNLITLTPVSIWVEYVQLGPLLTSQIDTPVSCSTVSPTISFMLYFLSHLHLPETGYSRKVTEQSEPQFVENGYQNILAM